MKKNEANLAPTLWRTCRVLANPNRLSCLKAVLKVPGRTVENVADAVGLAESKASLALRALQSRGILSSHRISRWTHYYPEPDASVATASLNPAGRVEMGRRTGLEWVRSRGSAA